MDSLGIQKAAACRRSQRREQSQPPGEGLGTALLPEKDKGRGFQLSAGPAGPSAGRRARQHSVGNLPGLAHRHWAEELEVGSPGQINALLLQGTECSRRHQAALVLAEGAGLDLKWRGAVSLPPRSRGNVLAVDYGNQGYALARSSCSPPGSSQGSGCCARGLGFKPQLQPTA